MQCYDTLTKIEYGQGTAIALGYFDGVHMGHRAVLGAAVNDAAEHGLLPAAFTFALAVDGGFKGKRILASEEKRRRIASLGMHFYLRPTFEQFCGLTPEQFVTDVLRDAYGAKSVFCGEDFTFGKNRAGNVALLKKLCAKEGIRVVVVSMAQYKDARISSTRIRRHLESGDMENVNAMLGEDYAVVFPVHHGKGLGRTLGFPTINQVYPSGMIVPKSGVYITQVTLSDGSVHPGATGLGSRPTVNENSADITCETFMPGFEGELYGESATIQFCHYLKPTVKFENTQQLQTYVNDAALQAVAYFPR